MKRQPGHVHLSVSSSTPTTGRGRRAPRPARTGPARRRSRRRGRRRRVARRRSVHRARPTVGAVVVGRGRRRRRRGRRRRRAARPGRREREARAIDRRGGDRREHRLDRLVRRLRRAVGPEQARLPAAQADLVHELEVEERADRGLAVGELHRVLQLARLIGHDARRARLRRDRLDELPVRLPARVAGALVVRHDRLEAVLEVPDRDRPLERGQRVLAGAAAGRRDAAAARNRLRGAAERGRQHLHQPRRSRPGRARAASGCERERRLARVLGIDVVAERVEDRQRPAARAVGLAERRAGTCPDPRAARSR